MGTSSPSTVRSTRLYSICSPLCAASEPGQSICLSDPPRGSIRDADVENLALANNIVQTSHDFFHGCDSIPDVHPVQVDVVGLQSLQTGFQCLHHILAVIASRIGIVARSGVGVFRG